MNSKDFLSINQNNAVVIGLQFGDEGKGKVVDLLAENFDYVARFQGGDNAGHTIVINSVTHKLSLIPSGIFHGKKVVLGSGVVINPYKLKEEIERLEKSGVEVRNKLFVADNASLIFSINKKLDLLLEKLRVHPIGTTGKGIGTAYMHRVARQGVRICDLFGDKKYLEALIQGMISEYNLLAGSSNCGFDLASSNDLFKEVEDFKQILEPFIVNSAKFFQEAMNINQKVLFEGAQGCGLDINYGTYPFVTSSSTFVGQVALGAPIAFQNIGKVYGVLKAYATRVGSGILITENYTDENDKNKMQSIGQEIGTVTGRTRRCGWLDLVATKFYIDVNGVSAIILTKIDVLDSFAKIKVCIGYEIEGKRHDYLPSVIDKKINPVYKEFDGWNCTTIGIKKYNKLPKNAKNYIEFIEDFLGIKIEIISNGAGREEVIYR